MFIQGRSYLVRVGVNDVAPDHDDQVARRQTVLRPAEAFAKQALEPVSPRCSRYLFTRDRKPETRTIALDATYQDRDKRVGTTKIILEYLLEFGGTRQSQPARERFPGARCHVTA